MSELIYQTVIALTGAIGVAMITRQKSWNKWGHLVALSGQWAWLVSTWNHKQWGIFILTIWYSYHWALGCYNFIIRPRRVRRYNWLNYLMNNSEDKVFQRVY